MKVGGVKRFQRWGVSCNRTSLPIDESALAFRSNGMLTLPTGARVLVIEVHIDSGTVEIVHEGELITMFLVDLETRGGLIEE